MRLWSSFHLRDTSMFILDDQLMKRISDDSWSFCGRMCLFEEVSRGKEGWSDRLKARPRCLQHNISPQHQESQPTRNCRPQLKSYSHLLSRPLCFYAQFSHPTTLEAVASNIQNTLMTLHIFDTSSAREVWMMRQQRQRNYSPWSSFLCRQPSARQPPTLNCSRSYHLSSVNSTPPSLEDAVEARRICSPSLLSFDA